MTPFVAYEAYGLFYEGVVWRTSVRPDLFTSLGLGSGVEAGLRWDFTPGINGHLKVDLFRRSTYPSCLSMAANWHHLASTEGESTVWSAWVGYITGSEWRSRRSGFPFSIAAGVGLLGGSGTVSGEEATARAFGYYVTVGLPVRLGHGRSLRVVPEVSHLGSTVPVVLGYENVFGVLRVPILSNRFFRFGISVSYVTRL